jgi:hypothetical protein
MIMVLYSFGAMAVEMTMEHEGVRNLMDSGEKFDVCVLEIFNTDAAVVRIFFQGGELKILCSVSD